MKKINLFIILLLAIFTLTSCANNKKEDEGKLNKEEETKFLEIINTPLENYTCDYLNHCVITAGDQTMTSDIVYLMKVNKDKVYMNISTENEVLLSAYYEKSDEELDVWANVGDGWSKNSVDLDELDMPNMIPAGTVEAGDFKKEDGVWVGNVEKLNDKLKDLIFESLESMGITEDVKFTLESYKITIENDQVAKVEMDLSFSMITQGVAMDVVANYTLTFTDHNKTQVIKPEGIE